LINMLKRIFKFYFRDTRAATAVEFAIIALPFIIMVFGVMEVSRILWIRNGVEFAAKETIRYAAINNDMSDDAFQTFAAGKLEDMALPGGNLNISSSTYTSNTVDFIQINVNYDIDTVFSGFLPFSDFSYDKVMRRPVVQ